MTEPSQLRDHVHGGTWFDDQGDGDAVVLIHGVGLDHTIWKAQIPALANHHHVITYDMLGHGRSAHPPGTRTLGDFVRQLHQLLMNVNIERASIVGFSMGGLVARQFAIEYPEMTSGLVLLSTVFRRTPSQQASVMARYEAANMEDNTSGIDAALERWFTPGFAKQNPEEINTIRSRLLANDRDAYLKAYEVFASNEDPTGQLSIDCPTLVLTGELDSGSTSEMAKQLSEAISGAELDILPGLKHMVPIEGASVLNQKILGLLKVSKRG